MSEDDRRVAERRTQALRGPGAGGFTPPHSVAASNPCLNCGTNVQLEFCPECGQRVIDSDPTLREFLHEIAEEFLHWDGKLVSTFRTLVARPGALTVAYLSGRRVSYISPLRVYLTCSLLFFFLNTLVPPRIVANGDGQLVERGVVQISASTPRQLDELDAAARSGNAVQRLWMTHLARAIRTPQALQRSTKSAIPKAMFALVPLFAALVGVVYRDRRRKYPQHLAFALHLHAALFLTLSVMLVERFIPSALVGGIVQGLLVLPFVLYAVRSARVVYDGRRGEAIWRLSLASALYFFCFVAAITALLAITILLY